MTRSIVVTVALAIAMPLSADDDVPSEKRKAGDDENKQYFLIGAAKDRKAPGDGFGLVVIMPGGDGSAEFHPFVKRLFKNSLPEGYLAVQPIAVKWTDEQEIVWPTARLKAEKMKFTTEEFVAAVIADVGKSFKLDPKRTFTLSWSSSGPAAYVISMQEKPVVAGSLIAMSVFRPDWLPDLKTAKGHAYYLYHSPDDRVCPYRMAVAAEKQLKEAGATVKLANYDGGHGWRGDVYHDLRAGIEWLEKNSRTKK
jgi:predicted esterase